MVENRKIAIVYTGLGEGGISSSLGALLQEISNDNNLEITLYLFKKQNMSRFLIPYNISIQYPSKILNLWFMEKKECRIWNLLLWYLLHFIGLKISMKPLERIGLRKKLPEKYDIAIAFTNDINSSVFINNFANDFVLKCLNAERKISWSHNDPYRLGYTEEYIRWRYEKFDTIVNVSNACKVKFDTIAPFYMQKSKVVHNCVYEVGYNNTNKKKLNIDGLFHIISVCRLDNKQKRIDRAIDTCAYLKAKGYGNKVKWQIYGSGSDLKKLCQYAEERDVKDILTFEGSTASPLEKISECDVFVMTSDYEACSLTLLESLVAYTPVIVTDFPEAREAIDDRKNGFIVKKSAESVGEKIIDLIENKDKLEKCICYLKEHPVNNNRALTEFYSVINN